eukprot:TRINITY_DN328_c0_g1_i5.p1 TRINITY_DN328_c0_g1~~TRINITY_DN328_c0_g1_i5.p1  ORF type:complete len:1711 (+),score=463.03 TRINITY_DN328_c0_g1_i5:53-5185(+)
MATYDSFPAPPASEYGGPAASIAGGPAHSVIWGPTAGTAPYERVWNVEEMRAAASQGEWTLAADSGLLFYLKDFSQRLIQRTREVEKNVDNLVFETKSMDVKLHNTFNQFLMLANTQFIENRIEETEVATDVPALDESSKPTESLETIVLPKYQKAMDRGMNLLDKFMVENPTEAGAVDDISLQIEDHENRFSRNPLPYIIGTQDFLDDDYVGLYEMEVEEESVEDKNEESSEVEDPTTQYHQSEGEDEEDDEDEDEEYDDEEDQDEDGNPSAQASRRNTDANRPPVPPPRPVRPPIQQNSDDDEKDDDEDDDEPPRPSNPIAAAAAAAAAASGGLKAKGPFADSDDEAPIQAPPKKYADPFGASYKSKSIFDDDESDIFAQEVRPKKTEPAKITPDSLFADDSNQATPAANPLADEEDTPKVSKPKVPSDGFSANAGLLAAEIRKKSNRFAESSDEEDASEWDTAPVAAKPPAPPPRAKPETKESTPVAAPKKSLFDDDEEEAPKAVPVAASKPQPKSQKNIFDDEDDDTTSPPPKQAPGRVTFEDKGPLDDPISENPSSSTQASTAAKNPGKTQANAIAAALAARAAKAKVTSDDTDESDSDDALSPSPNPLAAPKPQSAPAPTATAKPATSQPSKANLFGDDEPANPVPPAAKPATTAPVAAAPKPAAIASSKKSIFDDDDDDLFPTASSAPAIPKISAPAKGKVSIFGESDDDEPAAKPSPVTAPSSSASKAEPPKPALTASLSKSKASIFDESDDDGPTAVASPPPKPAAKPATSAPLGSQAKSGLFGDDEIAAPTPKPAAAAAAKPASATTTTTAAPKSKASIFDESDDDQDTIPFSTAVKPAVPAATAVAQVVQKEAAKPAPSKPADAGKSKASLFDEDEDTGSLFGPTSKAPATLPTAATLGKPQASVFEESTKPPVPKAEEPKPSQSVAKAVTSPPAKVKSKASVFDDSDDDDDSAGGLFGAAPKTKSPAAKPAEVKPSSGGLFGDDPVVPAKPVSKPAPATTTAPTTTTTTTTKPAVNPLLADDNDTPVRPVNPFSPPKPAPESAESEPSTGETGPVTTKKVGSKIGALAAGLQFRPDMLMGGGPPKPKPVESSTEVGTAGEANAQSDVAPTPAKLEHVTATRAKASGRRLPTRKPRQIADPLFGGDDLGDQDDEDVFSSTSTPSSTVTSGPKSTTEKGSLFDTTPTLPVPASSPSVMVTKPVETKPPAAVSSKKSIFDDDEDAGDDLFGSTPKTKPAPSAGPAPDPKPATPATPAPAPTSVVPSPASVPLASSPQPVANKAVKKSPLFDDEEDLFGSSKAAKPAATKPPAAAGLGDDLFGEKPKSQPKPASSVVSAAPAAGSDLFDAPVKSTATKPVDTKPVDTKPATTTPAITTPAVAPASPSPAIASNVATKAASGAKSLFDEDEDPRAVVAKVAAKAVDENKLTPSTRAAVTKFSSKSSLFDEEEESPEKSAAVTIQPPTLAALEPTLAPAPASTKSKKSLFDDDLFADTKITGTISLPDPVPEPISTPTPVAAAPVEPPKPVVLPGDAFSLGQSASAKVITKATSDLFGDDLFGGSTGSKAPAAKPATKNVGDDDLFGGIATKPKVSSGSSLFGDDLFGAPASSAKKTLNAAASSIFDDAPPKSEPQRKTPAPTAVPKLVEVAKAANPLAGDDDDLFSGLGKSKPSSKASNAGLDDLFAPAKPKSTASKADSLFD